MKASRIIGMAAAAILGTGTAFAASSERGQTTFLTGPYIGVYGGYDWTDIAGTDPRGWDGGVFAGYKIGKLFGGGTREYGIGANGAIEVFYGISNSDRIGAEKDDEWGVSFRPGISILDRVTGDSGVNPYGILGYRNTKFDVAGYTERYDGFELGIGAEVLASNNIGVRLEYSHTWYGSENGINPDTDSLRAGLSFRF